MPAGLFSVGPAVSAVRARRSVAAFEDLGVVEVVQVRIMAEIAMAVGPEPVLVALVVSAGTPGVRPARLGLGGLRAGLRGC